MLASLPPSLVSLQLALQSPVLVLSLLPVPCNTPLLAR